MPPKYGDSNTSLTFTQPSTPPHPTYTPIRSPGSNELLIKVHAAAINPVDVQIWGSPLIGWLAGNRVKGIGRDYAGEIVAVGAGLHSKWSEGDRVFGFFMRPMGNGTFTQHLVVASSDPISKVPCNWSYAQAAAVPLVALTAFACLDWLPPKSAREGKRSIVISGASGGVGTWCVQLAKNLHNCHVIGVCSGPNAEFVQRLGADEIIDYERTNLVDALVKRQPNGIKYDLFIDCVGGVELFKHWREFIHADGAYVTIVGDKTSRLSMGGPLTYLTRPASLLRYIFGYFYGPRYSIIKYYTQSEVLDRISRLGEDVGLEVCIQEVIKGILDEGSDAWAKVRNYMEEGRVRGKIVVEIDH